VTCTPLFLNGCQNLISVASLETSASNLFIDLRLSMLPHSLMLLLHCWQGQLVAVVTIQVLVTGVPAVDDKYLLTFSNISTQGLL